MSSTAVKALETGEISKIDEICQSLRLLRSTGYGKIRIGDTTALSQYIMSDDVLNTIKSVHKYKISQAKGGYWYTKVKADKYTKDHNRMTLTAPTEEELYEKLIEWYSDPDAVTENMTMDSLYKKWMNYRRKTVENPNTVKRDEQHYQRYFKGTEFFTRQVATIKRPELKEFCYSVIRGETTRHRGKNSYEPGQRLTRKEWNSVKSILNGMFVYAMDYEIIKVNPLTEMKFEKSLFRSTEPHTKETEIFNTEEEESLKNWCSKKFEETGDTAYLLPILTLYIGTRVGETVALKWSDIKDEKYLMISKMEFRDQTTNTVSVVNHTKTYTNRKIPLSDKAIQIFDAIRAKTPKKCVWIFNRDGERLTERQANYILEKYANDTGNRIKSSHKLRKTCGSNLYKKNGLTTKQCSDYLGHSEKVFEDNYLFDTDTDEELFEKLNTV